jgi:hypothetical protein
MANPLQTSKSTPARSGFSLVRASYRMLGWTIPSMRSLRLSAYLTCVFLAFSCIAGGVVYGQVKDAALALGEQLSGLSDLSEGAQVVLVNGERFHRSTVFSNDSVSVVLDRIQASCSANPGLLGQTAEQLLREHPRAGKKERLNLLTMKGIVRQEEERRGMVACFTDDKVSGVRGFVEAAGRFAKSSDLGEFGRFRYAFAHRAEGEQTLVTLLWADTSLNLSTMFPAVGDAAGADSRVLPRPNNARRTLAAAVDGEPYAIRLYDSSEPPAAVEKFYGDWMKKNGWTFAGKLEGKGVSYLRADGLQVIIGFVARDGRTTVSLTEAGRTEGELLQVKVELAP